MKLAGGLLLGLAVGQYGGQVWATTQISVGVETFTYDYDDEVKDSLGYRLAISKDLEKWPLRMELGYRDSGDADLKYEPGFSLAYKGLDAAVALVLGEKNTLAMSIRAGGYYGDFGVCVSGAPFDCFTEVSHGFLYGLGFEYPLAPDLRIRLQGDIFPDFEDLNEDRRVVAYSLSLAYSLGAPERPAAEAVVTRPAAAVAGERSRTSVAATAMSASPGVSEPPAPPPPGPVTRVAVSLRGQPRAEGPAVQSLPAGAPVTVVRHIDNASGRWFYVSTNEGSGWVKAEEIEIRP